MSKIGVEDRRAHRRHPTELHVQGTPADESGVVARLVTRNLSLGGLYCTSTADFPEMTRLAVRLMLPLRDPAADAVPVDVEAVVVRRRQLESSNGHPRYEFALFFPSLDPGPRSLLRRFLAERGEGEVED